MYYLNRDLYENVLFYRNFCFKNFCSIFQFLLICAERIYMYNELLNAFGQDDEYQGVNDQTRSRL